MKRMLKAGETYQTQPRFLPNGTVIEPSREAWVSSAVCPFCGWGAIGETIYQRGQDMRCSNCPAVYYFRPLLDDWAWSKI